MSAIINGLLAYMAKTSDDQFEKDCAELEEYNSIGPEINNFIQQSCLKENILDFKVGDIVLYDSCGIDIKAVITEIKNNGSYPIIIEYNGNLNPVNKNQIKLLKKF